MPVTEASALAFGGAFWAAPGLRADARNIEEPVNAVCSGNPMLRLLTAGKGLGRLVRFRDARMPLSPPWRWNAEVVGLCERCLWPFREYQV